MRRLILPVLLLSSLAIATGCVERNVIDSSMPEGRTTITGQLVAKDTSPWAYDGNAVLQVAVPGKGMVPVHLPARWNLCAAPPVDVDALAVGDTVRVTGDVDAEGAVVVCADAAHRVAEVD